MTLQIRTPAAAVLLLAGIASAGLAQDDPRAAKPERPTVATHAYTVAPGYVEGEIGAIYQNPSSGSALVAPLNLKFGLAPRLQLNLTTAGLGADGGPGTDFESGIGDLTVSVKYQLGEDLPVLGDFAIQPAVKFATGDSDRGFGTGTTDGSLLLVSSHPVGAGQIDVNAGWTVRDGDGTEAPKHSTIWAVAGGMPLGGGVGWTTEVFGYPGTSGPAGTPPQVGLLLGPTYALHNWLILDAGAIVNLQGLGANSGYLGMTVNLGRLF
jgi:hypothetical protein